MANDLATPEDEVFIHDGERPVTRSSVKTIHKNNNSENALYID